MTLNISRALRVAAAAFFVACAPALAQMGVPNHGVPVSHGGGASGTFNAVGPCLTGIPIIGAGVSADPVCGRLPNGGLAQGPAASIRGNPTNALADVQDFTIQGLPARGAPDPTNDKLLLYDNATGLLKYVTPGQVASAGALTIDGNYSGWAVQNCTLAASVSGGALTVAIKDNAGSDPSALSPCNINFRSATAATGSTVLRQLTSATSFATGTNGSTFGSTNNVAFRLWIVAFDTGSSAVIGVIKASTSSQIYPINEGLLQSSTACGACTTATNAGTYYTTSALSSKPVRILGYLEWGAGLVTAGTYASGPTIIQNFGAGIFKPGEVVQSVQFSTTTPTTNNTTAYADTALTKGITPQSAANYIATSFNGSVYGSTAAVAYWVALRRGGTIIGGEYPVANTGGGTYFPVSQSWMDAPGVTSLLTYTVAIKNETGGSNVTFPAFVGGTSSAVGIIQLAEIMG